MITVSKTPSMNPRPVPVHREDGVLRLPSPPADAPPVDLAVRAAQVAVFELRRGAGEPVRVLYGRAHSLLREIRRHLALLDSRLPAA